MRKRWASILALGIAFAIALTGGAIAYKPTVIVEGVFPPLAINGSFKPTRLPEKELGPVHLALDGSELFAGPAALKEAIFEIDRNVAFDAKGLTVCRPRPIDLPAEPRDLCREARVGKGEMEFEISFSEVPPFTLKSHVIAYNGGKRGGVRTILVHGYLPSPVSAAVVVRIEVTKIDRGRYGSKLVAAIPAIAGGNASLKKFQLDFFRRFAYKHKKQSFLLARCSDGRLQVHWEAVFADGTDVPGGFKRPCTPQP
jgi:hypothetical protein